MLHGDIFSFLEKKALARQVDYIMCFC